MGYYQGDYYRGDYYQGSPLALIGGALKLGSKLVKPAVKIGSKVVKAVGKVLAPGTSKTVQREVGTAVTVGTGVGIGTSIAKKVLGGGTPTPMVTHEEAKNGGGGFVSSGACGRGPRLDRDGVPCAKKYGGRGCSHRMNVANPRALRRSIRRARGFAKLARKVLSFPISKPPKGRALFRKR